MVGEGEQCKILPTEGIRERKRPGFRKKERALWISKVSMCCSKVSAKGMLLIQKSSSSEVVNPGDSTVSCGSRRTPQEKCRNPHA